MGHEWKLETRLELDVMNRSYFVNCFVMKYT